MLEGGTILPEFPNELGVLLWQRCRDVLLWAATPQAERAGLFHSGSAYTQLNAIVRSESAAAIRPHLDVLGTLAVGPTTVALDPVRRACQSISEWAEAQGAPATALAFAEAASDVEQRNAAAAVYVGVLALRMGKRMRGLTWLRRSIALARRSDDWDAYQDAYLHAGHAYAEQDVERARLFYMKSLKAARRHGRRVAGAVAAHALFRLLRDQAEVMAAEAYARRAWRSYPRDHPGATELMHELARHRLARGNATGAMDAAERAISRPAAPVFHAASYALLAWAAAVAGAATPFARAWATAVSFLSRGAVPEAEAPPILADLIRAASSARDRKRAEDAAGMLIHLQTKLGLFSYPEDIQQLLTDLRRSM